MKCSRKFKNSRNAENDIDWYLFIDTIEHTLITFIKNITILLKSHVLTFSGKQ